MGGFHLGKPHLSEAESIKLIQSGIDRGINFMDNSWDYNDGASEERMGKALAENGYRKRVLLMTKIDGRTKASAEKQIGESLKRLQTDHVDVLQFHEVIRFEDPDRIFAEGGAIEAFLDAKKAGKTRYIGFTGHKDPRIHNYMLEVADRHEFTFDTVQMPINVMDAHFRSFEKEVLPNLVKRNIGVLGMKSMGDTTILKSGKATAMECLHYALTRPTSVVITGIDKPELLDPSHESRTELAGSNGQAHGRSACPYGSGGEERAVGALQDQFALRLYSEEPRLARQRKSACPSCGAACLERKVR